MTDDRPPSRPMAKWVRHGVLRIDNRDPRLRLDLFLARTFPYRSRTQWARMVEAGRIRMNGQPCRPSRVVVLGDRIDYVPLRRPEPELPPESRVLPILYSDEAILAVNKPANLPVHPVGRYFRNTLLCLLLEQRGESLDRPGIRIVHRLDRETSGVVLFGKTRKDAALLSAQFERRSVSKEYLALVHGIPPAERFTVDAALGRDPSSRVRKAVGVVPIGEGRAARTDLEVLARGEGHSLLLARPQTGRLHQIRVHLKHAGFPVVGDKLYGLDEGFFLKLASGVGLNQEDRERLLLARQGLHAWRIQVRHPRSGEVFRCVAPMPEDLRALCAQLGVSWAEFPDPQPPAAI